MKHALARQEIINTWNNSTKYSDQKVADKLEFNIETVRNARLKLESDIFTYLGKNFVNYRVHEVTKVLQRFKKKWQELEDLKEHTTETVVKSIGHPKHGEPYSFADIVYTKPSTSMLLKLSKEQIKIDSMITKILTSGILKLIHTDYSAISYPLDERI